MGSGTILDTARLRYGLSEHFKVAQRNIHAYVFGEHGDTSFIPWTSAYISGLSTDEYYEEMKAYGKEIEPLDKEAMPLILLQLYPLCFMESMESKMYALAPLLL